MPLRISTDVGGTFTDYIVSDNGTLRAFKELTTLDPSQGIIKNLKRFQKSKISEFSHGTTTAVNAVLEHKGSDVIFFTTKGFKDLVRIGRQSRNHVYTFFCEKPKVPIKQIVEVNERVTADGNVLKNVDESELLNLAEKCNSKSKVAVVGFINSYKNPVNEMIAEKVLSSHFSLVITSQNIRSEIREYDRFCSAIIEGYISPIVKNYLDKLNLISKQVYIMQSNGGKSKPEHLKNINLLFSGPAGGVAATQVLCNELGIKNAIAYDMGGTSVDISAIVNGLPLFTDNLQIEGIPIKTLATDIMSIGAGGGSIAWVNDAGLLKVGPTSAGSIPGPACYNRGGAEFTVSDANLLLGILGSSISGVNLSLDSAREISKKLVKSLYLETEKLCEGVIKIVNNNMASALKNFSLSRGYDPRKFTLVAFGGAGPMHACALAKELGIQKILIPAEAGAFSALGILTAPVRFDYAKTILQPLNAPKTLKLMEKTVNGFNNDLRNKIKKNYKNIIKHITLDLRYIGQGHDINIPLSSDLESSFHRQHQNLFEFSILDNPIEVVNVKMVAEIPTQKIILKKHKKKGLKNIGKRSIHNHGEVFVYSKTFFGSVISGPSIIEDKTTTIFVGPNWNGYLDLFGNLLLECV